MAIPSPLNILRFPSPNSYSCSPFPSLCLVCVDNVHRLKYPRIIFKVWTVPKTIMKPFWALIIQTILNGNTDIHYMYILVINSSLAIKLLSLFPSLVIGLQPSHFYFIIIKPLSTIASIYTSTSRGVVHIFFHMYPMSAQFWDHFYLKREKENNELFIFYLSIIVTTIRTR